MASHHYLNRWTSLPSSFPQGQSRISHKGRGKEKVALHLDVDPLHLKAGLVGVGVGVVVVVVGWVGAFHYRRGKEAFLLFVVCCGLT